MESAEIGAKIRDFREKFGLSQAELAEGLEVSRPTITHWESGRREMDATSLAKAAVLLGIEPGDLIAGLKGMTGKSVNDRVRALLRSEGPHLAARWLEVDPTAIQAVIDGKLRVDPEWHMRIAQSYGVSYLWLMTGKRRTWAKPLKGRPGERLRFLRITAGIPITSELSDYWPSLEADDDLLREESRNPDSDLNRIVAPMLTALIALDEFSLRGLRDDPGAPSMQGWDWVIAEDLD